MKSISEKEISLAALEKQYDVIRDKIYFVLKAIDSNVIKNPYRLDYDSFPYQIVQYLCRSILVEFTYYPQKQKYVITYWNFGGYYFDHRVATQNHKLILINVYKSIHKFWMRTQKFPELQDITFPKFK